MLADALYSVPRVTVNHLQYSFSSLTAHYLAMSQS